MPHNNEDTEIIKFTHNRNNVSTYTKTKIDTLLSAYVLNSASTQFAGNANTATNAQNDGSGNNIENTYATKQWVEGKNYLTTITSGMITSALGFTPANSSSLNNYLLKSSDKVYSLGSHFFGVNASDATYQYCKLCTIVSTGDNGSTSQIYCTVHEGWNYLKNQKNSYCLEISCDFVGSITNISDSSLLRHLGGSNSCKFYIARRGSNYKICDVYVEFRKTSWISVSVHVTGDVQTYVDSWGEPVSSLPTTVENQIYVSSAITCGSLIDSSDLNNYLPKTGGTITGNLYVPSIITTHWVQADASSGKPGGFRAQAVNGVQFFETFTDNNNDGGICLRSRNGNAGYMKYSDNLGLYVISSAGGAWNEGLYIINSTANSFATMTLGTSDRSNLFAMVCNTDSNNYRAYLETKNPSGGLSQYNMPLGKTGTIALTSDLIKSTTFNSPSFETLVQFIATHNVVSIRSVYYGDDYTRYSSINYEVLDDENAGYSGTFWIGTSRVNNFSGYTVIVYYI